MDKRTVPLKSGTWKSLEFTLNQARQIMKTYSFDTLPPSNVLYELGYNSLPQAIINYHGGFSSFRKLLGERTLRTKNGAWRDINYVKAKVREAMKEQHWDNLPCSIELFNKGYGSLSTAIQRYHGGFRSFRKKIGQPELKLTSETIKRLDWVLSQLKEIMRQKRIDRVPSVSQLRRWGYDGLYATINKYHGGMKNILKIFDEESERVERNGWKDISFTLSKAQEFLRENPEFHELPGYWTLNKLRYSSLGRAISKYHGGFGKFRERLGRYMDQPTQRGRTESLLEDWLHD